MPLRCVPLILKLQLYPNTIICFLNYKLFVINCVIIHVILIYFFFILVVGYEILNVFCAIFCHNYDACSPKSHRHGRFCTYSKSSWWKKLGRIFSSGLQFAEMMIMIANQCNTLSDDRILQNFAYQFIYLINR